ncbi:glycosyltransferase [Caproicibacter fermentans]|uniref:Glycosyltransferase n=1 Tax=Caproicibacter fermentans TaxID=2576756 RepID=A0A7G8TB46_9FIRM|nr:glycosyltransferase [Caproicibacter fermentans]QNK40837.1 glycosyltransferase [Caproicibacter fermentans]
MKILLVNKFHYPKGGAETYYFTLADALKNSGHEVVYFSMLNPKNIPCRQSPFFVSNVDYNEKNVRAIQKIRFGFRLVYSLEAKKKMERLIQQEKPDLAVLNLVHRQITLSILEPLKRHGIPVVFVAHDLVFLCPNCTMLSHGAVCERCSGGCFLPCILKKCVKNSRIKSVLAAMEACFLRWKKLYDRVDLYLSPSFFLQDKMTEAGFTRKPICFLRNPLPIGTIYRMPEHCGDSLLYFGRLSPEKGILTLLKALKEADPRASMGLTVAGDGPQRPELERFTAENGLTESVRFVGFQSGEALQKLLEQCKCVVLPSEWYENCPYSILEAMAKGRPCIVSNLGGLPELVEDGVTGYIFKAGSAGSLREAIAKLYRLDDQEYAEMCKNALERAKKEFSAERYLEKFFQEYKSLSQHGGNHHESSARIDYRHLPLQRPLQHVRLLCRPDQKK